MSHWDPNCGAPSKGYPDAAHSSTYVNSLYDQSQSNVYTVAQIEAQYHNRNNNHNSAPAEDNQRRSTSNQNHFDVSTSNLQPTAVEFRPGTSYSGSTGSNGAVRKNYNSDRRRGKARGQDASRFKSNGERTIDSKKEQNQAIKETMDILNKMKMSTTDRESSTESRGTSGNKPNTYERSDRKNPRHNRNEGEKGKQPAFRGNNGYQNNQRDDYYGRKWSNNERRSDNWRYNRKEKKEPVEEGKPAERSERYKSRPQQIKQRLDAGSQRERLEQMVLLRMLECLVCCERLRNTDKVWSCKQCYHILHLSCVVKWVISSKLEKGWRCPACQNVYHEVPSEYRCYCDKYTDPKLEPGNLPHSCGEVCGRKGRSCDHACTLLCHPGPCPDCNVIVSRACGCGSTSPMVKCSSDIQITCQNPCNKVLNCGVHDCEAQCHAGPCVDCKTLISQVCHCGKEERSVPCTEETRGILSYECGGACGKTLNCGNHACDKLCHAGPCDSCESDPGGVTTCPCGQTKLLGERTSCLDPIPCCDKVCNKKLKCGQPSNPHLCKQKCHQGDCAPCPLTTFVKCRCGHMDKELDCKDLTSKADDARCQKKCTKKRLCTKHKCNQYCCIEVDHECPLNCKNLLSCGLHRCEETCHRGRCPPCWRSSFQELYCECGSSVLYPPVPCGTRPPPCNKPCSRPRPCNHPPHHNCHTGQCPPCTIFTTRWCHGKHESRQTIPCYQEDFGCGLMCNREMPCGRHRCTQTCHKGDCPNPCTQPCAVTRVNCEHACNYPCHEPPCPNAPCKASVTVTCQCGLRSSTRSCMELAGEYQKIAMSHLASKMADIQRGQSVDITDIVNKQRKGMHKTLECNDECRLVERTRRLAIGLQIRNPDMSAKLTPRYSDYMRGWAKKDPRFCQNVHDKLTELVQLAKQSKQKSRSHSFDCMNKEKRHFVHEYCEHFGCETMAYDREPNRNIVATAYRDKSWLPSMSLIEFLQRENGQRKVPGPVLNKAESSKGLEGRTGESVSLRLQSRTLPQRSATPPGEYVDYFDNPP